jgi:hypothetical protein
VHHIQKPRPQRRGFFMWSIRASEAPHKSDQSSGSFLFLGNCSCITLISDINVTIMSRCKIGIFAIHRVERSDSRQRYYYS